jgi:hypothetical protein
MAKYFVFLYLEDPRLRSYLDLAIYLLNPDERWPAHVTIAGPFRSAADVPASLRFVEQLSILGRGRFENGARSTIFLRVGSRDIASRIKKPDFPNAQPHLTIYSGRDRDLADTLYNELAKINLFGVFYATHFEVVESTEQYKLDFRLGVYPEILPSTAGKSLDQLRVLDRSTRIELAIEAIQAAFNASLETAAAMKVLKKRSYRDLAAYGKAPHQRRL